MTNYHLHLGCLAVFYLFYQACLIYTYIFKQNIKIFYILEPCVPHVGRQKNINFVNFVKLERWTVARHCLVQLTRLAAVVGWFSVKSWSLDSRVEGNEWTNERYSKKPGTLSLDSITCEFFVQVRTVIAENNGKSPRCLF